MIAAPRPSTAVTTKITNATVDGAGHRHGGRRQCGRSARVTGRTRPSRAWAPGISRWHRDKAAGHTGAGRTGGRELWRLSVREPGTGCRVLGLLVLGLLVLGAGGTGRVAGWPPVGTGTRRAGVPRIGLVRVLRADRRGRRRHAAYRSDPTARCSGTGRRTTTSRGRPRSAPPRRLPRRRQGTFGTQPGRRAPPAPRSARPPRPPRAARRPADRTRARSRRSWARGRRRWSGRAACRRCRPGCARSRPR